MKELKRIEEKAGKIFFVMKETNKTSFSAFVKYWHSKWREDFVLENGITAISKHGRITDKTLRKQFEQIFKECSLLWGENTSKQMTRAICKAQANEIMPTPVYHMANRLGYKVFKAYKVNIAPTNNILSGFQIKKSGKVIAGKHYELSLQDVENILRKEMRNCINGKQTSNRKKGTAGTINIQQTKRNRTYRC
jgi:hypothetical protein